MEQKTVLGGFIARKRKERGLTQRELAQRLYVTESAVSKWERGLSYPDITLVGELCKTLDVTEHELITASEDLRQQELERHAGRYERAVRRYTWGMTLVLGASLLICLIVNLAVGHRLDWFFVVAASLALSYSLLVLPAAWELWDLPEKHRGLGVLGAFYVTLNLLLACCRILYGGRWFAVTFLSVLLGFALVFLPYVLRRLPLPGWLHHHKALLAGAVDSLLVVAVVAAGMWTAGGIWALFWRKALPVTLYALSLPWLYLLALRYIPANGFFRAGICLGVTGVYLEVTNSVLSVLLDGGRFRLLPVDLADWSEPYLNGNITLVCAMACLGAAAVFTTAGVIRALGRANRQ